MHHTTTTLSTRVPKLAILNIARSVHFTTPQQQQQQQQC